MNMITENTPRLECTKESPQPAAQPRCPTEVWVHIDAEETGVETETKVEYKCPNCGRKFFVVLGS